MRGVGQGMGGKAMFENDRLGSRMEPSSRRTRFALGTIISVFVALAVTFAVRAARDSGRPARTLKSVEYPTTATVRTSVADLKASGGDTSGFDCYACHDTKKPVQVTTGADGRIVLPKEHLDLVFAMRN